MKINELLTIKEHNEYKIEIKHSVFISRIYYVANVDEANEKIRQVANEYKTATHNVPAYRVYDQITGQIVERGIDDGEPAGTASKPMLDILKHKKLLNVLVIVTRYFGGTLLGTGGLVKAYSEATIGLIENCDIVKVMMHTKYEIRTNYEVFNNIKKILDVGKIKYDSPTFGMYVSFYVYIKEIEADILEKIQNEYYNNIIIDKKDVIYI